MRAVFIVILEVFMADKGKDLLRSTQFLTAAAEILFYALSLAVLVFMHYSMISFALALLLFAICQVGLLLKLSGGLEGIIKRIIDHKLLTFTLLLMLARTGLTLLHCFTRTAASSYAQLGVILSFLMLYGLSVIFFMMSENEHTFEKLFLVQALVFGTVMTLIFPLNTIADEPQHMRTAYNLSNIYMGIKSPPEGILMRKDDSEFDFAFSEYTLTDFDAYLSELAAPLKDDSLVIVTDDMEYSSTLAYTRRPRVFDTEWYQYTFSALGITLGRLLKTNTIMMYLLGRFFNLLFYILAVYMAIKILPLGKSLLYSIALLPMPMQLAASTSRDAFRIVCAMMAVSLTLRCFYQSHDKDSLFEEAGSDNKKYRELMIPAALIFCSILLLPLRNYIYSVLLLLPAGLFLWRRGILNKKRVVILILIPVTLAAGYIIFKQFIHPENIVDEPHLGLSWYSAQRYSKEYFINHPLAMVSIIQHTFWVNAAWYLETALGYWLGWLDVNYSPILVYLLLIALVLNTLHRSYEPVLPEGFRLSSGLLSLLSMILIMAGMAITWTEMGKTIIDGVQGRYFLPILFPFLLAFRGPSVNADERLDTAVICLQFITMSYIMQFLMLRMFG